MELGRPCFLWALFVDPTNFSEQRAISGLVQALIRRQIRPRNCGLMTAFLPGLRYESPVDSSQCPRSVRRSAAAFATD